MPMLRSAALYGLRAARRNPGIAMKVGVLALSRRRKLRFAAAALGVAGSLAPQVWMVALDPPTRARARAAAAAGSRAVSHSRKVGLAAALDDPQVRTEIDRAVHELASLRTTTTKRG
jgi:hypothetical protein